MNKSFKIGLILLSVCVLFLDFTNALNDTKILFCAVLSDDKQTSSVIMLRVNIDYKVLEIL